MKNLLQLLLVGIVSYFLFDYIIYPFYIRSAFDFSGGMLFFGLAFIGYVLYSMVSSKK